MLYRGKTMPVSADQVRAVRRALAETQTDFAMRFARSRFAITRWESVGAKFKYQSTRWRQWQSAVLRAIQLSHVRGTNDEQISELRKLQIFQPK